VFNTADGDLIGAFQAFSQGYAAGLTVAAADLDGNGAAEIVVGSGSGVSPVVRAFNAFDYQQMIEFQAYSHAFHGGVYVSAGDFGNDGRANFVTGAGFGGGPHVRVWRPNFVSGGAYGGLLAGNAVASRSIAQWIAAGGASFETAGAERVQEASPGDRAGAASLEPYYRKLEAVDALMAELLREYSSEEGGTHFDAPLERAAQNGDDELAGVSHLLSDADHLPLAWLRLFPG
jgi:hypothetical protein